MGDSTDADLDEASERADEGPGWSDRPRFWQSFPPRFHE